MPSTVNSDLSHNNQNRATESCVKSDIGLGSAWREGRHDVEADDDIIPLRINARSPAKADEQRQSLTFY